MAEEKDRLEEAIRNREMSATIAGLPIVVRKWTLRQGIRNSAKFMKTVMKVVGGMKDVEKFLEQPAEDLLTRLEPDLDVLVDVVADTIKPNFDGNHALAKEWIESIAPEEAMELVGLIVRLNVNPLLKAVGTVRSFNLPTAMPSNVSESVA